MRFSEELHNSRSGFYIGYFQCEKYFLDFRDVLLKDFESRLAMSNYGEIVLSDIEKHYHASVSVHIRRGDYVTLASASSVHGTCSKEYYLRGLKLLADKLPSPRIYFFSDDIDWVKNEFKEIPNAFFVEDHPYKKNHEDMILMSKCHSNIIANSSYSWWGAWLNQNPSKLVIAPARWFVSEKTDATDLIPEGWLKI